MISENIPDPMNAEQTWPTNEEIKEATQKSKSKLMIKRVPEGMSVYQSAWIPDEESDYSNLLYLYINLLVFIYYYQILIYIIF